MQTRDHILLLVREFLLVHQDGESVDSRRRMLEGNPVLLKHLQHPAAETDLGVHHRLIDVDRAEAFPSGYACDHMFGTAYRGFHDHRSRIPRPVGIADIDGNRFRTHRENRVLMKHGRAHIGELSQFPVGNGFDGLRIVDKMRVGHEASRHIGPVFIDIGAHCPRNNRACYIGTAARKCLDAAVRHRPVEARDNRVVKIPEPFMKNRIRRFRVEIPAGIKQNDIFRVDKTEPEVIGQDQSVQVLSARCGIIPPCPAFEIIPDDLKFLIQAEIQPESLYDLLIAGPDGVQLIVDDFSRRCGVIASVKHIRNLCIIGKSASRSRRNHIPAVRVLMDYRSHFGHLLRAGE